ncbi:hypothetical protein KL923_000977 [Ogataea haglerorum]|nr:hypothetical protein KL923_000977 [Ogataea haglerorum]
MKLSLFSIAVVASMVANAVTAAYTNSTTSSSGPAPSTSLAPSIQAIDNNGQAEYIITIPGALQFSSFSVLSLSQSFGAFDPSLSRADADGRSIPINNESTENDIDLDVSISGYSAQNFHAYIFSGAITEPGTYTATFALTLDPESAKRAERVYYLTATAYIAPSASSSSGASSSVPSSTSSEIPGVTVITQTASGTVTLTTTCTEEKCTGVETIVTGVTTVSDETTVYTTYCPLSTTLTLAPVTVVTTVCETESAAPEATTITVTCTEEKCKGQESTVVTGLTTVTDLTTVYTTYCPLTAGEVTKTYTTTITNPVASTPVTALEVTTTVTSGAVTTTYVTTCEYYEVTKTSAATTTTGGASSAAATASGTTTTVATVTTPGAPGAPAAPGAGSTLAETGIATLSSSSVAGSTLAETGIATLSSSSVAGSASGSGATASSISILEGAAAKGYASAGLLGAAFIAAFFY